MMTKPPGSGDATALLLVLTKLTIHEQENSNCSSHRRPACEEEQEEVNSSKEQG
jgi:hypothetical protein